MRSAFAIFGERRARNASQYVQAFADAYPSVRIEEVAGVNHYTLILGPRRGPQRVAAAIEAACAAGVAGPSGGNRPN